MKTKIYDLTLFPSISVNISQRWGKVTLLISFHRIKFTFWNSKFESSHYSWCEPSLLTKHFLIQPWAYPTHEYQDFAATTLQFSFTRCSVLLPWISLAVQWLRICLPVQVTWVQPLVQEEPTCHHRATKPVSCSYWRPCTLEPVLHNKKSLQMRSLCTETREELPLTTTRESPHKATMTQHSQK